MKDIFEQLTDEHELVLELVAELIDTADDEREVRAELLSQLRIELSAHAEAERTEVYARLRALSDSLGATIDDHLEQHDEIEALVLELVEGDIDADDFLDVVEELRAAVLDHVDDEENELLPRAREYLDREEALEIGERYRADKQRRIAALQDEQDEDPSEIPGSLRRRAELESELIAEIRYH